MELIIVSGIQLLAMLWMQLSDYLQSTKATERIPHSCNETWLHAEPRMRVGWQPKTWPHFDAAA